MQAAQIQRPALEKTTSHRGKRDSQHDQPPPHYHPHSTRSRRMVGKYVLSKTLGRGSMGKVKLAINIETNEKVAVKIVSRKLHYSNKSTHTEADAVTKETEESIEKKEKEKRTQEISREIRTIREANIMLLLDHPFIAKVEELVVTENYFYVFMELVDQGQLLDFIISHGKLKEKQARQFARQIASALDYCHRNSIVHRDLKVENILISRNGDVKIIDFGLSNVFSPRSQLSTFCGSLYFAAPELLDGRVYTGPEVDVWSFGVVLYVLVCGQVPFDDPTMSGMHAKVKGGNVEYPSHLSSDVKDLLQRMLVVDSQKRASMSEVITHQWMIKGYEAPVETHLPPREPLQLPIDLDVVHGMRGFEFGSEEQIKEQLEYIISSEAYQRAAKKLQAMTSQDLPTKRLSQSPLSPLTSGGVQFHASQFLKRRSFTYVMNDPQSIPEAYHPLISIYYLVKERMERDGNTQFKSTADGPSSSSTTTRISNSQEEKPVTAIENVEPAIQLIQPLEFSYTANGKTAIHKSTEEREEDMVRRAFFDLSALPRASDSGKDNNNNVENTIEPPTTPKENIFRRLSRRLSRQLDNTLTAPMLRNDDFVPPRFQLTDEDNAVGPTSTTLNCGTPGLHHSISYSVSSSRGNRSNTPLLGKRLNKILKRAASITAKDLPSHRVNRPTTEDDARSSRRLSIFTTVMMSDNNSRRNNNNKSNEGNEEGGLLAPPNSSARNTPLQDATNIPTRAATMSRSSSSGQQADDCIKPVYLKGLFSVSTTSAKKASAIRADIIRVLNNKPNIQYHETQDRFECLLLVSTRSNRQPPPGADFFEYSDDENNNNSRAEVVEEDLAPSSSAATVRFDIYIVKIPWLLGMRGIQFRRISGDPWQYKNACSIILDSLLL